MLLLAPEKASGWAAAEARKLQFEDLPGCRGRVALECQAPLGKKEVNSDIAKETYGGAE